MNYRKSFLLRQEMGDRYGQAIALEKLAKVSYAQGNEKESARLFGSADSIRKSISAPLSPAERKSYGALIIEAKKKIFSRVFRGQSELADASATSYVKSQAG